MIGFVSAGISASFAGSFADRHGRRTACLAFCVIYSLSCATLFTNNINVLFLGRVLGGISGTLLWSVFDSWLVAEFNQLMLPDADPVLSGIFSTMTTSNTCVAIIAGIIAEWLVRSFGTAKAPFCASVGCLLLAFLAISKYWVSLTLRRLLRIPDLSVYRVRITVRATGTHQKMPLCFHKKRQMQRTQPVRHFE